MNNNLMKQFHKAFYFINNHPAFLDRMSGAISHTQVNKIDKDGKYVEDFFDEPFERVEIRVEGGAHRFFAKCEYDFGERWEHWHDISLDSSGGTYEQAIVEYADKIKKHYGNFSSFGLNSVVPNWVSGYNKNKTPFHMEPCEDSNYFSMVSHDDYIRVSPEQENEIWWQLWGKENLKDMYKVKSETLDVSYLMDYDKFLLHVEKINSDMKKENLNI